MNTSHWTLAIAGHLAVYNDGLEVFSAASSPTSAKLCSEVRVLFFFLEGEEEASTRERDSNPKRKEFLTPRHNIYPLLVGSRWSRAEKWSSTESKSLKTMQPLLCRNSVIPIYVYISANSGRCRGEIELPHALLHRAIGFDIRLAMIATQTYMTTGHQDNSLICTQAPDFRGWSGCRRSGHGQDRPFQPLSGLFVGDNNMLECLAEDQHVGLRAATATAHVKATNSSVKTSSLLS